MPDIDKKDALILATDISKRMLEKAHCAIYPVETLKDLPSPQFKKYFNKLNGQHSGSCRITDEVRKMVRLAWLNLLESWPMKGPFNVIFCRNVMIYFDRPTQQRLINRFWELLEPGGFLFVGHSEGLSAINHKFRTCDRRRIENRHGYRAELKQMRHVVAVGDMKIGRDTDLIVTHALGSCLGLVVYDPVERVGGLLHAMLPLSKINPAKAEANPYMFVDTGVPALFKALYEIGGQKSRMVIKAAGCGNPLGKNELFKIGERNHTILKKLLWKNNILLETEDVGGTASRTLHFDVATGQTVISSNGKKRNL
jgi:chemotaxis receptor (MCP) glutamine deamidase CheD